MVASRLSSSLVVGVKGFGKSMRHAGTAVAQRVRRYFRHRLQWNHRAMRLKRRELRPFCGATAPGRGDRASIVRGGAPSISGRRARDGAGAGRHDPVLPEASARDSFRGESSSDVRPEGAKYTSSAMFGGGGSRSRWTSTRSLARAVSEPERALLGTEEHQRNLGLRALPGESASFSA